MAASILGIHHVTAMCGDAQQNLDFYAGTLGLRLVKVTVNFDDPGTYHLYYGNAAGEPSTLLTFFPWADASPGRAGTGAVNVVSLSIPPGSGEAWVDRLDRAGVTASLSTGPDEARSLTFTDPDGLMLKLVEREDSREPWDGAGHADPVPVSMAIRGISAVELWIDGYEASARLLKDPMGAVAEAEAGDRFRFRLGEGAGANYVDLRCLPGLRPSRLGPGSVHHVAFRLPNLDAELELATVLVEVGMNATPPRERVYFQSVYFREPGHVLYELATDGPGFGVDEDAASLGSALRLPAWLEGHRELIREALPPLRTVTGVVLP